MGPHARTDPRRPSRRRPATRRGRSLAVGGSVITSLALVVAVVATTSTASASAPEDVTRPLGSEAPVSATLALPVPADAALDDTTAPGWSGSLTDAAEGPSPSAGLAGLTGSALTPATLRAGALPPRVRAAYVAAVDRLARDQPACGLPWWLLAGVGQVESGHAAGGRVRDDGVTLTPIRGPRLDGTLAGTAVVRDSDRGSLDGDAAYDRAVGPMQFMPGTWSSFGADGDGDGRTDPDDVDDAALAAARYLCNGATGGALAQQGGQAAALFRYNRSVSYGLEVIRWGIGFRDGTAAPPAPQAPSSLPDAPSPSISGGAPAPTDGPGPAASPDSGPAPAAPPASPPAEAGGNSPTTEVSSDPAPDPAPSEVPGEQPPSGVPAPDSSAAPSELPTLPVCVEPEEPATDGTSPSDPTAPEPTTAPTAGPAPTPSDPPSPADPSGAPDLTAAPGEPSVDCLPPCTNEEDATSSPTSDASGSPWGTEASSGETGPGASPSPTDMDDPTDAPPRCAPSPSPSPSPSTEPEPAAPTSSSPTPTGR